MQIGDERVTVHGAVLCMIGDTPANNFIGGCCFALWKCRMCMVTIEDVCEGIIIIVVVQACNNVIYVIIIY
jgi:hypothetical protein